MERDAGSPKKGSKAALNAADEATSVDPPSWRSSPSPRNGPMPFPKELSPYELELAVREQGILPSLRTSGLKLVREGRTDLDALRKAIDMSVGD